MTDEYRIENEMDRSKKDIAEENLELREELDEEEWESDWGAAFWAVILLVIVLSGIGVAAWQPWIV